MAGEHQMVYVCVSGEDVPDTLLSHLKGGLESKGFSVFTHQGKMKEEAKNRRKVVNRIRVSRFVLLIFSEGFVGSGECFDTLVLVMKRMNLGKLRVIPLYYMMHQVDSKDRKGNFGYLLDQLEKAEFRKAAGTSVEAMILTEIRIKEWREALASVTNLNGFNFHHQGVSLDSVIEAITKHINEGGLGSISEAKETDTNSELVGTPVCEDEDEMNAMVSSLKNMGIIFEGDCSSEPYFFEKISEQVKEKLNALVRTDFLTPSPAESLKPVMRLGQVFISHKGSAEMLKGFVDSLKISLATHGITASNESKTLSKVIKYFSITVVIFCKDYSRSRYCMNELLVIKKQAENGDMVVFPVYYDVDPAHVRHQKGIFGRNFNELQSSRRPNQDSDMIERDQRVNEWKEALRCFAGKLGFVFKSGHVSKEEIVSQLVNEIESVLSNRVRCGY